MKKSCFLLLLYFSPFWIMAQQAVVLGATEAHYKKLGIQKQNIQVWEDGIRTDGSANTYEWWYFDAILADSSKLVFGFYTKRVENVLTGFKPWVMVSVVKKNGESWTKGYDLRDEPYHFSKEKCDLQIGKCTLKGDLKHYEVHLDLPDFRADLTLDGIVEPCRPETGHLFFGNKEKHFFAWLPAVPKGKIKGTMTYQNETKQIEGSGYHDHNWGNIGMQSLMNHWYWSRVDMGEYTLIVSQIVSARKYAHKAIPIFMVAKEGKILADDAVKYMKFTENKRRIEPYTSRPVYQELIFHYETPAESYELTLEETQLIEKGQFRDLLKGWKKKASKLLPVNPTYLRMTGKASLKVKKGGAGENIKGSAIWEQFYFGKNID